MSREPQQCLAVGEEGSRVMSTNVCVIKADKTQHDWDIFLQSDFIEMTVNRVEARKELFNQFISK